MAGDVEDGGGVIMASEDEADRWWNERDLSLLSGWCAQVWDYTVSHQALSIRFYREEAFYREDSERQDERFLHCVGCDSFPARTTWAVDKIVISEVGGKTRVTDEANGIDFVCGWTRLFGVTSFFTWTGSQTRNISIQRNGVVEPGRLSLLLRDASPERVAWGLWIWPLFQDPVDFGDADYIEALKKCLVGSDRKIRELRSQGIDVFWRTPGDGCELLTGLAPRDQ
jgi:hypothetical protein